MIASSSSVVGALIRFGLFSTRVAVIVSICLFKSFGSLQTTAGRRSLADSVTSHQCLGPLWITSLIKSDFSFGSSTIVEVDFRSNEVGKRVNANFSVFELPPSVAEDITSCTLSFHWLVWMLVPLRLELTWKEGFFMNDISSRQDNDEASVDTSALSFWATDPVGNPWEELVSDGRQSIGIYCEISLTSRENRSLMTRNLPQPEKFSSFT